MTRKWGREPAGVSGGDAADRAGRHGAQLPGSPGKETLLSEECAGWSRNFCGPCTAGSSPTPFIPRAINHLQTCLSRDEGTSRISLHCSPGGTMQRFRTCATDERTTDSEQGPLVHSRDSTCDAASPPRQRGQAPAPCTCGLPRLSSSPAQGQPQNFAEWGARGPSPLGCPRLRPSRGPKRPPAQNDLQRLLPHSVGLQTQGASLSGVRPGSLTHCTQ